MTGSFDSVEFDDSDDWIFENDDDEDDDEFLQLSADEAETDDSKEGQK